MASISTAQNRPCNIRRLAVQRHLYARAKSFFILQPLLAVVASTVAAIVNALSSDVSPLLALAPFFILVVNAGLLEPLQQRIRQRAAIIQEDFDCNVFGLSWNQVLAGRRPSSDDIYALCKQALRRTGPRIEGWYPAVVDSLPLHQGRIVCQRLNCRWDAGLRRTYRSAILVMLVLVGVLAIGWAVVTEMTVPRFLLAIAVPLSPTLLWAIREVRRQAEAAAGVDRLKDFVEDVWRDLNRNALTEAAALCRSRQLQDAIMVHRRTSPLVPDFFYRYRRAEDEEQMEVSAARMVAEITGRPDTL